MNSRISIASSASWSASSFRRSAGLSMVSNSIKPRYLWSTTRSVVASGDESGKPRQRLAGVVGDRQQLRRRRIEAFVDQLLDRRFYVAAGLGGFKNSLDGHNFFPRQVGGAVTPGQQVGCRPRRPLAGQGIQEGGLALAQVVADRLAGELGIAEGTQDVVAELERLAQREPIPAEGRSHFPQTLGGSQGQSEVKGSLDGVLGRLVAADPPGQVGAGIGPGRAQQVQVLAHVDLEAQLVEHL